MIFKFNLLEDSKVPGHKFLKVVRVPKNIALMILGAVQTKRQPNTGTAKLIW